MLHNINREICNTCQFWTGKKTDSKFKCYVGLCPAKLRDKGHTVIVLTDKENFKK